MPTDASPAVIRRLERDELPDVWSLDRAEEIERVFVHRGGELVLVPERHDVRGWPPGERERYEPLLRDCFDHGGTFDGAFAGDTLVGVAALEARFLAPGDRLQLKFLHVSRRQRGRGLGVQLFEKAAARARALGARRLYVSSSTGENTVRFYLNRGCRPSDAPDPELFALEPEDIHLELDLADR